MVYIGIDNGVTGTIGILTLDSAYIYNTPTTKVFDYTKKKKQITRVDHRELYALLFPYSDRSTQVFLERPMVNPTRFVATGSALRALEATLVTLEMLEIPYQFVDSKEWQKVYLPKGTKGAAELKKASKELGEKMFEPFIKERSENIKDYDGLFIALYGRDKLSVIKEKKNG